MLHTPRSVTSHRSQLSNQPFVFKRVELRDGRVCKLSFAESSIHYAYASTFTSRYVNCAYVHVGKEVSSPAFLATAVYYTFVALPQPFLRVLMGLVVN